MVGSDVPPAVPEKTRRKTERQPSPYDNVPEIDHSGKHILFVVFFSLFNLLF